jgi:TPR repeat protein
MGWHFLRFGCVALLVLPISLAVATDIPAAAPEAAAQQDETLALTQLAIRYEHAEGVARDFHQAANLYCRAARIGRAEAQYRLGWMYANGRGVPRDDDTAAALFALAAAQGDEPSKRILLYVRPKSATSLPACLLVVEWVPSLKLSRELSAAENVGEGYKLYQHAQGSPTARSTMQALR